MRIEGALQLGRGYALHALEELRFCYLVAIYGCYDLAASATAAASTYYEDRKRGQRPPSQSFQYRMLLMSSIALRLQ